MVLQVVPFLIPLKVTLDASAMVLVTTGLLLYHSVTAEGCNKLIHSKIKYLATDIKRIL